MAGELAPYLREAFPGITETQMTALVNNPEFMVAAAQITSIEVATERITTPPTNKARGTATKKCKTKSWTGKATGWFGTLFSFKTTLKWCYDGDRVYYSSHALLADVTRYGALSGWLFKGYWQDLDRDYYTWREHSKGGYVVQAFPLFEQCTVTLGCTDQKFLDVAARGHYDGTWTGHFRMN